jgi:hypothetical protein
MDTRLECAGARVPKMLGNCFWVTMIEQYGHSKSDDIDVDDTIEAFGHSDRTCEINFWNVSSSLLEECFPVMQEPFLALTRLSLRSER